MRTRVLLAVFACLAAATPPATAAISLQAAPSYPIGDYATAVGAVVGDFNGDGKHDVAAITWTAASVQIMLGQGDGRLVAGASFPIQDRPAHLAVADFNGDAIPDLALFHESSDGGATPHRLSIALGNGDGTFGASLVRTNPSDAFGELAAADFDGDGRQDLATMVGGIHLAVFPGSGDGSLQPALRYGVGGYQPTAGDYDGKADLIVTGGNFTLALVKNVSP